MWPTRPAARLLRKLVIFGFGIMTGAQVFVALGLVPSWHISSAEAFLQSYGAILRSERTDVLMPFFAVTIVLPSIAALLLERPRGLRHWVLALLPVLSLVAVIGITATVNVPINDWVLAQPGAPDAGAVAAAQARWIAAHYVRTAVAVFAYAALVASSH